MRIALVPLAQLPPRASTAARLVLPLVRPHAPQLTKDSEKHPKHPHDTGDHTVRGLEGRSGTGQVQADPAVDDPEGDHDTAVPNVQVRPDAAALKLLETQVVYRPQDGLEEKGDQHDDADDGMVADDGVCQLGEPRS